MRRYIITGSILLALSMACEEKKKTKRVSAPPPAQEVVLSSPIEIALPSVPSDASPRDAEATKENVVEKDKPAKVEAVIEAGKDQAAEPKMAMAAKVTPTSAPVQYEDVSSRVLAEGSRDEAKDLGLAKIREKALLRMKEMQELEAAEDEKARAEEVKAEQALASEKEAAEAAKAVAIKTETAKTEVAPAEASAPAVATAPAAPLEGKEEVGSKVAMVEPDASQASESQVVSDATKDQTVVEEATLVKNPKIDAKTAKALEIKFRKAREMARTGKVEDAKNLFLTICQAGHAHACHKFAWYEEQAGNTLNATRFYQAACDNGLGKSCNNLAFQFEQLKVYDKASELYAKGCREKHEASCTSLKRIREEQLQEKDKDKDKEKENLQTR